jgi:hypothetical protein
MLSFPVFAKLQPRRSTFLAPRIRRGMRALSPSRRGSRRTLLPCFFSLLPLPLSPFCSYSSALFHFPYPATPLFATLTKTPGVYPNSSHSGTRSTCLPVSSVPPVTNHQSRILLFSHSYTLFCIFPKLNSFLFKRFRTLCEKHPGWGWEKNPIALGEGQLGVQLG